MPRRRTLRRRLVAVVLGTVVAIVGLTAAVSAASLHQVLVDRLDAQLGAANRRAGAAEFPPGPTPAPAPTPAPTPDRADPPPGLEARGQGTGTITLADRGARGVRSGYLDASGAITALDDAQQAALRATPDDGEPRTVEVPGLGAYRVVATRTPSGDLLVTGLPLADAEAVVARYLATTGTVALAGLVVASVIGTALVRQRLRPLERVAATAARVAQRPLDRGEVALTERVPVADTDPRTEAGQVGAALNALLGHVEGALSARHASEMQLRRFVADVSHELRTPLTSIRGYAELVGRLPVELPAEVTRAIARIDAESQRMSALVEDMLLLARLDAGRPLERAEVDLAVLALDAVADAHAASRRHRWELDTDGVGTTVQGDEARLRQVLVNLLANARVHTPAGTCVTTSVRRVGDHVVLSVSDDGPGVPEELRPHIFDRFSRGDDSRARAAGSTGLGLAIVHAVVHAHGGEARVEDVPGGATFTITLPAAAAD